ncbi:MAG: hypothetical protein HY270_04310 [Deltaproteobacteria bacterium]|nr:hypothetical protein [Deltaproteobacteria bacterium]
MSRAIPLNIKEFATQRHYRPATIERWLALAAADGQALLDLAAEMRLGENQLSDLWTWAEDVARRDGTSLADVLTSAAMTAARKRAISRNDRLTLVKQELRRLRYPHLCATEERLLELLHRLELPRDIRVALPASLEGDHLTFQFVVTDTKQLRRIADELKRVADSPACADIFALLEEAP